APISGRSCLPFDFSRLGTHISGEWRFADQVLAWQKAPLGAISPLGLGVAAWTWSLARPQRTLNGQACDLAARRQEPGGRGGAIMAAPQLLMPKATAVWLVENTTLTFDQIGAFCN